MTRWRLPRLGRGRRAAAPARSGSDGPRSDGPRSDGPRSDGAGAAAPAISYEPFADGDADPGEVVWAWVPYEEDPSQGKDRPVLVLARQGDQLLTLMLSSKDHAGPGHRDRTRPGQQWLDVGTGAWDREGRPSEVRLDRVVRLAPSAVRREGAALDRARFDQVVAAARPVLDWV